MLSHEVRRLQKARIVTHDARPNSTLGLMLNNANTGSMPATNFIRLDYLRSSASECTSERRQSRRTEVAEGRP